MPAAALNQPRHNFRLKQMPISMFASNTSDTCIRIAASNKHPALYDRSRCQHVSHPHDDRHGPPRERVSHTDGAASSAAIWGRYSPRAPASAFDVHQTRRPAEPSTPGVTPPVQAAPKDVPAPIRPVVTALRLRRNGLLMCMGQVPSPTCRQSHARIGPVATLPFLPEMTGTVASASWQSENQCIACKTDVRVL